MIASFRKALGTLVVGLIPSFLLAQSSVPTKDVAILPDVSISVRKDFPKHEEAREMIIKLVTGQPIDWAASDWDAEVTDDPELLSIYGRYLGRPQGTVEPAPLTAPGRSVLTLPMGKLSTVNESSNHRQVGRMDQLGDIIRAEYPKAKDIKDGSTCFWYAMARTAQMLRSASPDGYYLFVVSDEIDDPDYLEFGPPGHSTTDYRNYKKYLAALYPLSWIQEVINDQFEPNPGKLGRDAYTPRPGFPMVPIAKFYQRKFSRSDETKVRLSWYVMGPKPKIQPPPAPAPAPVATLVPPAFKRSIALLGGLESRSVKTFNYENPLIVWQVPYGEIDGLNSARFQVQTAEGKVVPLVQGTTESTSISPRLNGPKTARLQLAPGTYTVQVVQEDPGSATPIKSKAVSIHIKHWNNWILPVLAGTAALVAIAIFIWTWLSFEVRTVSARPR